MKTIHIKYYIYILLISLSITSCQKVIKLDLANNANKLVIEANITDVPGPQYVKLSRSVPFTNTNTYPPVSGATVTIYNNTSGRSFNLTESTAGIYSVSKGVGIIGNSYTLTVLADGKTYTANSTMPSYVGMDSISATNSLFGNGNSVKGNKKAITVYFNDPANQVNQYRFVMTVNSKPVNSVFAFNDDFINGKHVTFDLQQNNTDIYPKDTVTVEMQCVDKPVYNYWFTLSQQQANNPGGQVAPANPPTNITPSVLGYFSAHTSQSITLVVK